MLKNCIILGFLILILIFGLSGCNDIIENGGNNNIEINGDTDLAQITNYNITTKWRIVTGIDDLGKEIFYFEDTEGVLENKPTNGDPYSIFIKGTVKNIAGKKLERIKIGADFLDVEGAYLDTSYGTVYDIDNSISKDFGIVYFGEHVENCSSFAFIIQAL
jgi:hypothetical protein